MNEFIDKIVAISPTLSIVLILIVSLVFSLRIWLQYKKETMPSRPRSITDGEQLISEKSVDKLSKLLVDNFDILERFYAENLLQYRRNSTASLAIAVLGFVVIVSGVLISLLSNQSTLGNISAAAGIVSEAAAMLFFKQNKYFQEQMQDSLNKLSSTQYLMISISLTKKLSDGEKAKELLLISSHLRKLMDSLHGLNPADTPC
jgi:hypothetical protein